MIATALLAALLLGAPQDTATPAPGTPSIASPMGTVSKDDKLARTQIISPKELAKAQARAESARAQAVQINDLAGRIHSEQDARTLVDRVAEELTHHRHLMWAARYYRRRVAHAEFAAVSDPSELVPEQRIVDVWNEYIREIDAPAEGLITVAELHNMRDALYSGSSHYAWPREMLRSIWTMPNIYALDGSGRIAEGCRALETLRLIHEMHDNFINVSMARTRVAQGGWFVSENLVQREDAQTLQPAARKFSVAKLQGAGINYAIVQNAARLYIQAHGDGAYDQMIRRLFDELFPPE